MLTEKAREIALSILATSEKAMTRPDAAPNIFINLGTVIVQPAPEVLPKPQHP